MVRTLKLMDFDYDEVHAVKSEKKKNYDVQLLNKVTSEGLQ